MMNNETLIIIDLLKNTGWIYAFKRYLMSFL